MSELLEVVRMALGLLVLGAVLGGFMRAASDRACRPDHLVL